MNIVFIVVRNNLKTGVYIIVDVVHVEFPLWIKLSFQSHWLSLYTEQCIIKLFMCMCLKICSSILKQF